MPDDITPTTIPIPQFMIYKLVLNSKVYIGYTKCPIMKRLKQHIYSAQCSTPKSCKKHTRLSHAIRKYGVDNIRHEILETVTGSEAATAREAFYIELYNSTDSSVGYNMLKNGAFYDRTGQSKEFYRSASYRKIRSEVVQGERNGRYTGYTDDQILDKAMEYFQNYGNVHSAGWFRYCKTVGLPVNYDPTSTFRFDGQGLDGFRRKFLERCKNQSIDVRFNQLVGKSLAGKRVATVMSMYQEFFSLTVDESTISTCLSKRVGIPRLKSPEKKTQDRKEYIEIAMEYFLKIGNIHSREFREYRKSNGRIQCIGSLFAGGEDGFRKEFLKECLAQGIDISLEQLCCYRWLSSVNKPRLKQLYHDHYQKIKNQAQGL